MSTKCSLILTDDDEHWHEDVSEPNYKEGKFIGNTIYIEMNKKNIKILQNDDNFLIVEVKAGSQLYESIKTIQDKN